MPRGVTRAAIPLALSLAALALGCAGEPDAAPLGRPTGCDEAAPATRTASCVQAFSPGDGAGFGADAFPEIIYGEPRGEGEAAGSLDVLSLGKGGEIAVGFGGNTIADGAGIDFIIFENAFYVNGNPENIFKELGEVSVSADGEAWVTFPCRADSAPYDGCAGWRPVFANPDEGVSAFDPDAAGGDPFDLADVGLSEARFVRVRDISNFGAANNAGFDLDAIAIVNASR
jgi:hypothetical protein